MICGICKQDKAESCFSFKNKEKGKKHTTCKQCHKINANNYYNKNKIKCIARVRKRNKKVIDNNKIFILEYLKNSCCIDCGEKDPLVLEFDHVNPTTKTNSVCQMLVTGSALNNIINEIKKCEIRCANCHRRKTAKQFGWYKYLAEKIIK